MIYQWQLKIPLKPVFNKKYVDFDLCCACLIKTLFLNKKQALIRLLNVIVIYKILYKYVFNSL